MKRFLRLFLLVMLLAAAASAQTAVVKRNVNLRPDPSTANEPVATLTPGTQVRLIDPDQTNGFFHVKTDTAEGWLWARNISVQSGGTLTPTPTPTPVPSAHVGPPELYPDPVKTPGLAETLMVSDLTKKWTTGCPSGKKSCTYSQAHRNVPAAEHKQVYDEYGVPEEKRNIANGEVDHFYPLCAGGSNDINNLWYQPIKNEWNGQNFGFKEKDRLETYICQEIVAGRMDPKEAFKRIKADWVKFYTDEGLDHVE